MVRCGVQPNTNGNAVPLDVTTCLAQTQLTATLPADDENISDSFVEKEFQSDIVTFVKFDFLMENIIVYISGFVVRKVVKVLKCNECITSLVTDASTTTAKHKYHLLELKNRGGLVVPAEGVVHVVEEAEKCIRVMSAGKPHFICPLNVLDIYVRRAVGAKDIFHLEEHIINTQVGIDNHHYQLMSLIVRYFHQLRMHHITKLHNEKLQAGNCRKASTKNLLFMGY